MDRASGCPGGLDMGVIPVTAPDHDQAERLMGFDRFETDGEHRVYGIRGEGAHREVLPTGLLAWQALGLLAAQLAEAQEDFKETRELLDFKQRCLDSAQRALSEAHSLRWLLGLESHLDEEPQSREDAHRNLDKLLDSSGGAER